MGKSQVKVSHGLHDPKQLGAATSSSNILSLCGGLGYTRLFARGPRNKRRTQKLTLPRSRFAIKTTTRKISIRKPMKSKSRRGRIPKAKTGVYFRYLKICLTASRCDVLGEA